MASAIFIPFRAHSIFMAEWRYAGTSMVNRFIFAFTKSPAICSRVTDLFSDVTLSYFIIYDYTIFFMGCQGKNLVKSLHYNDSNEFHWCTVRTLPSYQEVS